MACRLKIFGKEHFSRLSEVEAEFRGSTITHQSCVEIFPTRKLVDKIGLLPSTRPKTKSAFWDQPCEILNAYTQWHAEGQCELLIGIYYFVFPANTPHFRLGTTYQLLNL